MNTVKQKNEFSNFVTTSKRRPNKLKSDQGKEFYNINNHNFLKLNKMYLFLVILMKDLQ